MSVTDFMMTSYIQTEFSKSFLFVLQANNFSTPNKLDLGVGSWSNKWREMIILLPSSTPPPGVGGSRSDFWQNDKGHKFNKSAVLISNYVEILCDVIGS